MNSAVVILCRVSGDNRVDSVIFSKALMMGGAASIHPKRRPRLESHFELECILIIRGLSLGDQLKHFGGLLK